MILNLKHLCKPCFLSRSRCLGRWKQENMWSSNVHPLVRNMCSRTKVNVGGADLSCLKVGNGDHAILLLAGALGTVKTDFWPQVEKLNREKFTVIAFDARGYGESRPPERDFPSNFYHRDADDAVALMKKFDFPKYSLVGWSDGGNVACIAASQVPDRINKLVVWGSNSYVTPEDIKLYTSIRDVTRWSKKMRKPMEEEYGVEGFERMWHGWVDSFDGMRRDDDGSVGLYRNDFHKITAETLIVHGMRDPLVPCFHPEYLNKNIANSRLVKWDDGGHNLHLRYVDRFNRLLEDFLLQPPARL